MITIQESVSSVNTVVKFIFKAIKYTIWFMAGLFFYGIPSYFAAKITIFLCSVFFGN